MRIFLGVLTIALLAAWGHVAPAAAQCEPTECSGVGKTKAAKAKAAVKKPKAKDAYMKVAP